MENIRPNFTDKLVDRWPKVTIERYLSLRGAWYGEVSLGNGSAFRVCMTQVDLDEQEYLFVGVEEHGAYPFHNFVHWTYAAEKLKLMEADAANIADFINCQLGHTQDPEQGEYEIGLCKR